MGQEILYCNKCGKRLVGEDFTRGRAHTYNHRQYCTGCLPQQHATAPPPPPPPSSRRMRAPTAPAEARPAKPSAMIWVGVGLGIAAMGVIAVFLLTRPETDPPPPVPAGPSLEKVAQDLKDLEGKVRKLVEAEQFHAAAELLGEARKRYAAPEWEQPVARRLKEVQELPTGLYAPLKDRATAAQMRGALADAQKERARVVVWGRKDLLEDLDKALAAVIPREPLPPGAKVLVQYPGGDVSRYRTTGQIKDGSLIAVVDNNGVYAGFESGREIFKVSEDQEIRVVFTTSSPKLFTVILRAVGPDGKIHPFNHWVQKPDVGKPQVIKASLSALRSWSKLPMMTGGVVDNLYIRQDDTAAVLKIHEFVIYQTKP